MIPELSATRFSKVMGSGRTQPCLMVCEDEAGEEVEVVVKLRKHPRILTGAVGFSKERESGFHRISHFGNFFLQNRTWEADCPCESSPRNP